MWFKYTNLDLMLAVENGSRHHKREPGPPTLAELKAYRKLVHDLIRQSKKEIDRQRQNVNHLEARAKWIKAEIDGGKHE